MFETAKIVIMWRLPEHKLRERNVILTQAFHFSCKKKQNPLYPWRSFALGYWQAATRPSLAVGSSFVQAGTLHNNVINKKRPYSMFDIALWQGRSQRSLEKRLKCAGHVARMDEGRVAKRAGGTNRAETRRRGRPQVWCEDCVIGTSLFRT